MTNLVKTYTDHELMQAVVKHGGQRAAARETGVPRTTIQEALSRIKEGRPILPSRTNVSKHLIKKPEKGVKRFILCSVQDNTAINKKFLENLEAYAAYTNAEIMVAGYTYGSKRRVGFAQEVLPYITEEQVNIGGKLLFCAEMRITATASRPLSGLETYTRSKWGVFPHPRVALQSVATMFAEPAKQIMTTGTLSLPNYSGTKAGIKTEFHHIIGALMVEIDSDGDVFCRHLICDKANGFQDLDVTVHNGTVSHNASVQMITWGDIHTEQIDPLVRERCWERGPRGSLSLLDTLRPKEQFFHDACDFLARNHHNIKDPHHAFKMHKQGVECVERGMRQIANFLRDSSRSWCKSYVVESNHDLMLLRWLKEADYKTDPVNAVFFLDAQRKVYDDIARDKNASIFEWAVNRFNHAGDVKFLRETDTHKVVGIECALHGHKGANGAKGHINSFAKMGPKANVGHTHSAQIHEGIYCAGTASKLDLGYNAGGLSSWSHSHIVTYPNGKRTIITMQAGKWRA